MKRPFTARLHLAAVLVALFALVLVSVGTAPLAQAATIIVNSTAGDVTAGDGNCTLREAINNAESDSDTTSGDCSAGSGADTIELSILSLTYTLDEVDNNVDGDNGLPSITTEITIIPFLARTCPEPVEGKGDRGMVETAVGPRRSRTGRRF